MFALTRNHARLLPSQLPASHGAAIIDYDGLYRLSAYLTLRTALLVPLMRLRQVQSSAVEQVGWTVEMTPQASARHCPSTCASLSSQNSSLGDGDYAVPGTALCVALPMHELTTRPQAGSQLTRAPCNS